MPLSFRHYKELIEDWLSYVIAHSSLTDINPGSVLRTLGEATSIENSRLYVQLRALLNLFSIDKASGEDLDERALDFDAVRRQPTKSVGSVVVGDSNITAGDTALSTLAVAIVGGVSTTAVIQAAEYASFPASGDIVLSRADGGIRELVSYTSKTPPDTLNLSTTPTNNHPIGATVHLSTVGADRTIASGTVVKTNTLPELKFETTQDDTLYDGDYQVIGIPAQSIETGKNNNVASGQINRFESPPFPTATVNNPSNFYDGQDLETDAEFRTRIKNEQLDRDSSTKRIIEQAALSVEYTPTGQRVVFAKMIEPILPGACELYISDGTAYTPTTVDINVSEFLISSAEAGARRAIFDNWPLVDNSERLYVSLDRGTTTAVGLNTLTDGVKSWTVNQWTGFKVKDVNDAIYSIVSNTATTLTLSGGFTPASGDYAIFDPSNTLFPTGSLLVKNTDYIINNTNGQIELPAASFPTGLTVKDALLAYYNGSNSAYVHYDGLLQEVQKVVTGDIDDITNYPGEAAAGTMVTIYAPTSVVVSVEAGISVGAGYAEASLYEAVKTAILTYINNLGIGEDVIKSKLIDVIMNVEGVYDVAIPVPTGNVAITDTQLARTTLSDIVVT